MTRRIVFPALLLMCVYACAGSGPVRIAAGQHDCDYCHRNITELAFASQVVVPGQEPMFFDDLQCLKGYLASVATPPAGAKIFVADHRTSDWVAADTAVFSRVMTLRTPLNSHLAAYASATSRDSDPEAVRPIAVDPGELIPAQWHTATAAQ